MALIVPFRAVQNALEQAARLGSTEPRQQLVDRVLEDVRAGRNPNRVAGELQAQRLQQRQGGVR
jgi:hypothetical protein